MINDESNASLTAEIIAALRLAYQALSKFDFDAGAADCVRLELAITESLHRAALVIPALRLSNGDGVRAVLADPRWCSAMTEAL